jgi:hypothetical protein
MKSDTHSGGSVFAIGEHWFRKRRQKVDAIGAAAVAEVQNRHDVVSPLPRAGQWVEYKYS